MINIRNLSFGYDEELPFFENLNLDIEQGTLTTIIGPNGCGKSTLMKLAARQIKNYQGEILLDGKELKTYTQKELAKTVSMLPQSRNLTSISVESLVAHGRYPHLGYPRILKSEDKEMIEYALELTGLLGYRQRKLTTLSGGERQRAYIAMTIAQDAKIMFLDEPTTYLDMKYQFDIMALVTRLQQAGKTLVMILHQIDLALKYSQQVIVMNQGLIELSGTPGEIYKRGCIDRVFDIELYRIQGIDGFEYYATPKSLK